MSDRQPPQNFGFAAGESFVLVFDVDQVITGMTVRFAARRLVDTAAVLATADGNAVPAITGPQQCTVTVQDENTQALSGTYQYSAEIEDGAGAKSEIAWGFITFSPEMV